MLTGDMLKQGFASASHHLDLHKAEVDALNVFPVPDGDTGTNMAATVAAAAQQLQDLDDNCGFSAAAEQAASAMLRAARGNSGVILSLIFRGFAKAVQGLNSVDGQALANALEQGAKAAYSAVAQPAEGTILTVARQAAQQAQASAQTCEIAAEVWESALNQARETLAQTPAMLPVLRQAGVVDAGGQGLVYIMQGLLQGFTGSTAEQPNFSIVSASTGAAQADIDYDYDYCIEVLIERTAQAPQSDGEHLRTTLLQLGDSVLVAADEDIIKVHVHSNQPGDALNLSLQYGQLVDIKIDNMRKQEAALQTTPEAPPKQAEKAFGIVAVANGPGMVNMLREIGVDQVVNGGQSLNPATEDLLQAVEAVAAQHVFILPNNKNIVMAATQAAQLSGRASVVETTSVAQGVAAVLSFDPEETAEENQAQMLAAAKGVQTGLVTYAARDSRLNGLKIAQGAVIGLENSKLTLTDSDPIAAGFRVAQNLVEQHDGTLVTIYFGEDITQQQADQLADKLATHYNDQVDITCVNAGQPLYYFIIAVE